MAIATAAASQEQKHLLSQHASHPTQAHMTTMVGIETWQGPTNTAGKAASRKSQGGERGWQKTATIT